MRLFTLRRAWMLSIFLGIVSSPLFAQDHSVAMKWNEVQLQCIRKDAARPTIQARNLFHASVVMYDCWAAYDDDAATVFLGQSFGGFEVPFDGILIPEDRKAAQEKCISYAMYRYLTHRYQPFAPVPVQNGPSNWTTFMSGYVSGLMNELGFDPSVTSTDYSDGDPAKLGNYIALKMQEYGLQDGSNQGNNYANQYYQTVNGNLHPQLPGNTFQEDGNRWQPLALTLVLDQNGFPMPSGAPALSPEWGNVIPFALTEDQNTQHYRDGHYWNVYLDQGPPPYLDTINSTGFNYDDDFFKWGYVVNSIWHSLHDPSDGVMKDISPNGIGNVDSSTFPVTFEDYKNFYNVFDGGDNSPGYEINPATGLPYPTQLVPRADYTRVLSEFWADGPNSETPPGHWFTLINYVLNHPDFEYQWEGQGEELDHLEFDVRAYLALGGGIHDAAIACWGTKGYYDYTRPIMAIRYMIDRGQCSDPFGPNYHPGGIPLVPGYIELVQEGDELAGFNNQNVGKIKLYTWRGPIAATGFDGVGWILGENWWTFQRHTFVTPPFPGYYSGHSTYSRTGAEILKRITGSEYFPGGVGEFHALQNQYLMATQGPSVDITLQWATYGDASDQCSLSRIYGGLHPPCDDIPGRRVGFIVGPQAYEKANAIMNEGVPHVLAVIPSPAVINDAVAGSDVTLTLNFTEAMNTEIMPTVNFTQDNPLAASLTLVSAEWMDNMNYVLTYSSTDANERLDNVIVQIIDAVDMQGKTIVPVFANAFLIDTENPAVTLVSAESSFVNDEVAANGSFEVSVTFSEDMSSEPTLTFTAEDPSSTIIYNAANSYWSDNATYVASLDVVDINETISDIDFTITIATDEVGNTQIESSAENLFAVDTQNPTALIVSNNAVLADAIATASALVFTITFDEDMNSDYTPVINFTNGDPLTAGLTMSEESAWISPNVFEASFDLADDNMELNDLGIENVSAQDLAGNSQVAYIWENALDLDTKNPLTTGVTVSTSLFSDEEAATGSFEITITFDDDMSNVDPTITFPAGNPLANSMDFSSGEWTSNNTYLATYTADDSNEEIENIDITISAAQDNAGNAQLVDYAVNNAFEIDTRNPEVNFMMANTYNITSTNVGNGGFYLLIVYDEPMNTSVNPNITFPNESPAAVLSYNSIASSWLDENTFQALFNVSTNFVSICNIDIAVANAKDLAGNNEISFTEADFFDIHCIVNTEEISQAFGGVNVYPNPASAGTPITMNISNVPSDLNVVMIDATGKVVSQQNNASMSGNVMSFDTNNLASGMYYIHLQAKGERAVFKVSVIR